MGGPSEAPALAGQVVVITGAGRGIGRAVSLGLARHGMTVALLGRCADAVRRVAGECRALGTEAIDLVADVRRYAEVQSAVDAVATRAGRIDLLVNNAGVADRTEAPPWEVDADDWWSVLETNLRGSYHMCRAVIPLMLAEGGGRIVNVNSNLAVRRDVRYSAYGTSKAALLAWSDTIAAALDRSGVRVFDVSPGMVRTAMTETMTACRERGEWTGVDRFVDAMVGLATGRFDPLAGRYLHVGVDDLAALAVRDGGLPAGARTLRLVPHGHDDPLG